MTKMHLYTYLFSAILTTAVPASAQSSSTLLGFTFQNVQPLTTTEVEVVSGDLKTWAARFGYTCAGYEGYRVSSIPETFRAARVAGLSRGFRFQGLTLDTTPQYTTNVTRVILPTTTVLQLWRQPVSMPGGTLLLCTAERKQR